MCENIWSEAE